MANLKAASLSWERWLETVGRTEMLAVVTRASLRAFPLMPDHVASRLALITAVLRLTSSALFSIKYQMRFPTNSIIPTCEIIEEITGTAVAPNAEAASHIGSIMYGRADLPKEMARSAIKSVLQAHARKSSGSETYGINALNSDILEINTGASVQQLVLKPLWLRGTPRMLAVTWKSMKEELCGHGSHWVVWTNWYDQLLSAPSSHFPNRRWDEAFVDARGGDPLPWDEGPRAVNETISSRLLALNAKTQKELPIVVSPTVYRQELDQRPSSHRFDWRAGRIEATQVAEPPFDEVLALALAEEILAKAQLSLLRLEDNSADEVMQCSIKSVVELLSKPVAQVPEGILLSRSNTLAAFVRAYSDPANERERNVRAVLDDFAVTVQNLVDCYPGIRSINANRVALGMQDEDASKVEAELINIAGIAKQSGVVAGSALAALEIGKDEVANLLERIDRETNLGIAADYIKARGEAVASRLSDAVNFASATLQQGALEIKGLTTDTWTELRKRLPKAAARGAAKGVERASEETVATVIKLPIIGLAYLLAGPLAALAVFVPRLGAHRRKSRQLHQIVETAISSPDASDSLTESEFQETLKRFLSQYTLLTEREERVLRLKYGIGIISPCSDEVIAEQLSVSKRTVRAIHSSAMQKLFDMGLPDRDGG